MNKKLPKKIAKNLDKLFEILGNIEEARIINPNDPNTWDPDILYDLTEQLKKALKLLEDQKSKQKDAWGEPIILEEGLCSLVDSYHEDQEEEDYD